MSSGLSEILGHNTWANRRLIDACAGLTDGQLDTGAEGTFGTIRDTLVHIVEAEQHYLFRMTGNKPDPLVQEGQWPGFDLLRERAEENGKRFGRLLAEGDPGRVIHWTTKGGEAAAMPVTMFLVQTIYHGNEHRSQVATSLDPLGHRAARTQRMAVRDRDGLPDGGEAIKAGEFSRRAVRDGRPSGPRARRSAR